MTSASWGEYSLKILIPLSLWQVFLIFMQMYVIKFVSIKQIAEVIITFFTGIPAEKIVQAHGSFEKGHCVGCKREHSQQYLKGRFGSTLYGVES